MRLLLHICCANCALYPVIELRGEGVDITGYWFNPNIHPYGEYQLRLDTLKDLQNRWHLDVHFDQRYSLKEYLDGSLKSDNRCAFCYTMRLEETARFAKDNGFDAFSTTLMVSPYQKFDIIVEKGMSISERYNIEFLVKDWRSRYRDGLSLSREMGLYRQKYCGCIFSEMERYMKRR